MTLAPGWRLMSTITAGTPRYQPPTPVVLQPVDDAGDVAEHARDDLQLHQPKASDANVSPEAIADSG